MAQERLQQARDLIRQQRYDEARTMLFPIRTHPTARKWLARLDEIAPIDSGQGRAVNLALGAVSLLSGVAGAIILVGLLIFAVQGMQQGYGSEYAGALPWAVAVLILLPVAYVTRKLRR